MAAEAIVADADQHIYTRSEVEYLLWTHFQRRPQMTTHGRSVAKYAGGPYICPRCLGDGMREGRTCGRCRGRGRVTDVMPTGSATVSVPDALLSKADLYRAMRQLDLKHRTLLLYFYATDYTPERIGHLLKRHNGGIAPSVRTVYRWRAEAVAYLVAVLNRTYARSKG